MFRLYTMPGRMSSCTKKPMKNNDGKILVYETMEALRRDIPNLGRPSCRIYYEEIKRISTKHIVVS